MAKMISVARLMVGLVILTALTLVSGCASVITLDYPSSSSSPQKESTVKPNTESGAIPTGNELYAQGKGNFLAFLEQISELQMTLDPGQWRVGDYGDYPSHCRTTNGQDGYFYSLHRDTTHQDHDINAVADGVEDFLASVGYEVERREHNPTMRGVMAWGTGAVFQIYYVSRDNGSMSIMAQSNCFPGNSSELISIQTDSHKAVMPPQRETVSPTDPVQYGQELPAQPE